MKRSTREFLLDIDQNIERAIDFVQDLNFEQFCQDRLSRWIPLLMTIEHTLAIVPPMC